MLSGLLLRVPEKGDWAADTKMERAEILGCQRNFWRRSRPDELRLENVGCNILRECQSHHFGTGEVFHVLASATAMEKVMDTGRGARRIIYVEKVPACEFGILYPFQFSASWPGFGRQGARAQSHNR